MPIDRIIPYAGNSKKHPQEQIAKLASMLIEYGFDQPIVVDKDMVIIKGHGRRLAAIKAGIKEVPVIVREDLSIAKARASRIADNKIAETDWDLESLIADINVLKAEDESLLAQLGFDEDKLLKLTRDQQTEEAQTLTSIVGSQELKENDFNDFNNQCPRCGFEFNNK